jgi:hypothetical protein
MPDAVPFLPIDDKKKLTKIALDLIETCRQSQSIRAGYYRVINQILESGKQDGGKSLINLMYRHVDRFAAHLFSPTDLRFIIDFENEYPTNVLDRGKVVARSLTRTWERNNTDMTFGQGVAESGKYGACVLKQWVLTEGTEEVPRYQKRLIQPWQFGVYREDENDISAQTALCETSMLTLAQVWRRIHHLPQANDLFRRVERHAGRDANSDLSMNYFHEILSSGTLQAAPAVPKPGGLVNFGNNAQYAVLQPEMAVDLVRMHELWVQDGADYTTVQLVEPDILIAPLYKKANLLIQGQESGLHPYTLIQPNVTHGYFWGRPEIVDLIEPQTFLSRTADDIEKLFGLQVDKILGIIGMDGLTDELYDQQRNAGYLSVPMGGSITDLTPKFPPEALPLLNELIQITNMLGGFPPIMQGQGEQGVRAGVHANTLMKTASPTLRDRSLLVERQCAIAADLTLTLKEAKDGRNYWTNGKTLKDIDETSFKLTDLPEDWRVAVDSHSSSPIFADDHAQLIAFGVKAGFIDGHSAIDLMPFPQKELLHARLKAKEEAQQKLMQEHPELLQAMMRKQMGARR